ncbi:acyl-CoA dehydrogenase [Arthrobacter sp. EPSL27]|nr:acyl-CoA dehydrogenase [Arthrobacter sp. EPSL27]
MTDVLPESLLDRIRGRAAGYDRDNAFFSEDLEDLAAAGYLKIFVPAADGGLGLGLAEAAQLQRRLATAAPATALAVNMHLVWTGVAHVLAARGDSSLDFVLKEAAQGEIFAFGNSEAGNDSVLFDSRTVAVPDTGGGYSFTGRKIFTSLSPAWTRLGIFGKDTSAGDGEGQLVHGFITRDTPGYEILADWDTLGMRASQSNTTVLDGAVVPAERIFRKLPVGPNADPLIFAIFACFETLLAAVYTGIGERALVLGVEAVKRRTSFKNGGRSYAQDPDIRWKVADAAMAMDALYPQLSSVAADVDALADHGGQWFPKLVGLKVSATETARTVVDLAIRVSGGSSYFRGSELERLYRDVLAGMFHPSDDESAHNTVANAWLGPLETA